MKSSATVRREIENALSSRIPAALTPQGRMERVRLETGNEAVDRLTQGGFPVGAITELVGAGCSGRTSLATAFVARRMGEGQVCAWVDVSDALDPETAAAAGVDLERMLWVRCGGAEESAQGVSRRGGSGGAMVDRTLRVPTPSGGCGSPHPRSEGRGLPRAIEDLMGQADADECDGVRVGSNAALLSARRRDRSIGMPSAQNRRLQEGVGGVSGARAGGGFSWRSKEREEQVPTDRLPRRRGEAVGPEGRVAVGQPRCSEASRGRRATQGDGREVRPELRVTGLAGERRRGAKEKGPWGVLEQALRVADLVLQAGGFGVVVLDMGDLKQEVVWRIPMATWFRFRAAAERTRCTLILLTQHACARSSAELVLEMQPARMRGLGRVMTGLAFEAGLERQRFVVKEEGQKVVSIRRKEPEAECARESEGYAEERGVAGRRKPPERERSERGRWSGWDGEAAWAQASGMEGLRKAAVESGVRRRAGGRR